MNSSAVAATSEQLYEACQLSDVRAGQWRWFSSIPPERIGLHGEFDYHGLSKRVSHCLSSHIDSTLKRLKVRQRGRVVMLSGRLGSPYQLHQVVTLALSVDGVDEVDTRGIAVPDAG